MQTKKFVGGQQQNNRTTNNPAVTFASGSVLL